MTVQLDLLEYAKLLTQNPTRVGVLNAEVRLTQPLLYLLDNHFVETDRRGELLLPELSVNDNETIAVFSDFAGEGSGRNYTYSFLICAWNQLGGFQEQISKYRGDWLPDREISFKKFNSADMQKVIPEYLRALDFLVPGLLFTLVVPKSVKTLFGPETSETLAGLVKQLENAGFGVYKPKVAEKILRIVYVSAYLTALHLRPGQKVFWMTDNDEICSNEAQHKSLLSMFQNAVTAILRDHELPLIGGGTPFEKRDLKTLDLLSAADVTASSLEHYLTLEEKNSSSQFGVKEGAHHVLKWLANDGLALKKQIMKIVKEDNVYKGKSLQLKLINPDPNAVVLEVPILPR